MIRITKSWFLCLPLLIACSNAPAQDINFNRDIRPILSDKCFYCHGPDEGHREADLRLDLEQAAHDYAIVPNQPDESEFIARITSTDVDEVMPPQDSGKGLKKQEIAILERWIDEGAHYDGHWSFTPPSKAGLPEVANVDWVRNPIDRFVLAKLETQGMEPSPELDRARLLRRLSLDLTGLPPTPEEVTTFLNDSSAMAYERAVDRLLDSERYGERMALVWLDAARYADTNGYQNDNPREMWIWRDWVIDAYNHNMPFDQFTIEQLAGDMLPNATVNQKIASGFHRNHRINSEGGVIPEEYRVEYVIDRVSTTGTVWLGMTLECARCHSHKYDPISQEEFYQLFSYFNNVPENGRDGSSGNAAPMLTIPIPTMKSQLDDARRRLDRLKEQYSTDTDALIAERKTWEDAQRQKLRTEDAPMWQRTIVDSVVANNGVRLTIQEDGSILASGSPKTCSYSITLRPGASRLTGIKLEALRHPNMTNGGLSRSVNGNFVLTEFELFRNDPDVNRQKRIRINKAIADHSQNGYPITNSIDSKADTGWAILGTSEVEDRTAVFSFDKAVSCTDETTLTVNIKHDSQFSAHNIGHFRLSTTGADEPALDGKAGIPEDIIKVLHTAEEQRTEKQQTRLDEFYRQRSNLLAPIRQKIKKAEESLQSIEAQATTSVMVMEEMPERRPAFLLNRGQYDQPGKEVFPDVPQNLGQLPEGAPNNRLGLAKWLIDPKNPLTSRVTINRYWQMYFGLGLVRSASDFGAQGEWPSHPELLDWLALEFIESGWDVKAMQKLIVMSATYRQSSAGTAELHQLDPDNRLLARGPRFRLSAFAIRDQALAVSGLLNEKLGGPSVYPYQPSGMWAELAAKVGTRYPQSKGADLYRRSLYTFWKRAVAPPTMLIFDASGREACNVNRNATNTPLQSLATLNDVQFVEAARFLAQRMMLEGGQNLAEKLSYGWRLVLVRQPDPRELSRLKNAYQFHYQRFTDDTESANALLALGQRKPNPELDRVQLAAFTTVANVILNLDETITKE